MILGEDSNLAEDLIFARIDELRDLFRGIPKDLTLARGRPFLNRVFSALTSIRLHVGHCVIGIKAGVNVVTTLQIELESILW